MCYTTFNRVKMKNHTLACLSKKSRVTDHGRQSWNNALVPATKKIQQSPKVYEEVYIT